MLDGLKRKAKAIKRELLVLYLSYRDPRVPWYAKLCALCVVAYACSPIDLIPDFIPVLGYLDDLILVPLGIALTLRLIPQPVLADCRIRAEELRNNGKPTNWLTAALFIALWIGCAVWLGRAAYGWVH